MASEMKHTAKPISLVAVVDMNGGEALVLNRPLAYVYERDGNDYVGKDGPFKSRYAYERAHGRFVGFAGREIVLNMADGSMTTIKDHWWDNGMKGCVSVAANCIDVLKKCYVFFGCNYITPEDLAALRSTYTGCVYPYCEYEKLIKFDDTWKMVCHERNRVEALIAEVKDKSRKLNALAGIADPAAFVKRAKAIEAATGPARDAVRGMLAVAVQSCTVDGRDETATAEDRRYISILRLTLRSMEDALALPGGPP